MPEGCPDLWRVWGEAERIRANLGRALLRGFRGQVLEGLEAGLAEPFAPPEATAQARTPKPLSASARDLN